MRDTILNDSGESTSHFINSIPLSHPKNGRAEPKVMNVIINGADERVSAPEKHRSQAR